MVPSEFRADLHCHSNCSDGSDAPEELLRKAKGANLKCLSITDHDTVQAYTPALFFVAESLGIELLPGIEISTELDGANVHILGYCVSVDSPDLRTFLHTLHERRSERNRKILANLVKQNMPITEEELMGLTSRSPSDPIIGRPHIAALMVKKGYVSSFAEAFDRYLKEGGTCYVSGFKFTPSDAIGAIHKAGGKAVIAHPHFIKNNALISKLLSLPFDGIECYYSIFAGHYSTPWLKVGQEKGWISTGGSDYHGSFTPQINLGASWVGLDVVERLKSHGSAR
ncbi:PHP domain-containing protein [Candidatus Dojkabacteria bacterium]|uniref:PHP domain-containing protein n=1 Tax=Candidatus Dojkabacteria bacterium TaxID=2099670 RepID=A0A5C7J3A2_9BACT|nr:MAG: PHP domain-containing protein [Candidatus Dojkabacteria bacterium]